MRKTKLSFTNEKVAVRAETVLRESNIASVRLDTSNPNIIVISVKKSDTDAAVMWLGIVQIPYKISNKT